MDTGTPLTEAILPPIDEAPGSSPRPRPAPNDIDFGLPPASTGGGGGGGGSSVDGLKEAIAETQADIARLKVEAVELIAVANSGREVGDALEYACKRAELLYAAQEEGREITPELRAEIDQLALSYSEAGAAAETAADRLDMIRENAERGADTMPICSWASSMARPAPRMPCAGCSSKLQRCRCRRASWA